MLHKMGKVDSNICALCNSNIVDDIEHGFLTCTTVNNFKKACFNIMNIGTPSNMDFLFGFNKKGKLAETTMALYLKHFIYMNKLEERLPTIQALKNYLKNQKKVEKYISKKYNELRIHEKS